MTLSTASNNAAHLPVMADTCVELLAPALTFDEEHSAEVSFANGSYPVLVDATLGLGGHTEKLLRFFPQLHVIGIDRDSQARSLSRERLQAFAARVEIVGATYGQLGVVLAQRGITHVDGILADLGVSSVQLDQFDRGFSYAQPQSPLDMRMTQDAGFTAADYLAQASAEEIAQVLRTYGEEKFAWPIAKNIVRRRESSAGPLSATGELVELIKGTIPAPARRTGGNPAKRTFQALRIAVNNELGDLADFLPAALTTLRPGGRLVIESYQSLEDRLVKQFFASGIHPEVPKYLPMPGPEYEPWLKNLTQGALKATSAEIEENPRAQSVRIRAVEKICHPLKPVVDTPVNQRKTPVFPTLERLRSR